MNAYYLHFFHNFDRYFNGLGKKNFILPESQRNSIQITIFWPIFLTESGQNFDISIEILTEIGQNFWFWPISVKILPIENKQTYLWNFWPQDFDRFSVEIKILIEFYCRKFGQKIFLTAVSVKSLVENVFWLSVRRSKYSVTICDHSI